MMLVPASSDVYVRQMMPSVVPHLVNLDTEIRQILNNNSEAPDVKLREYNQVLKRYMKLREELEVPLPPPPPPPVRRDQEVRNEEQIHARQEPEAAEIPAGRLPFDDNTILEGIPSRNVKAARLLLGYLKRNTELSWNENGEMIVNGEQYRNTNIIDLMHDFSRHRKTVPAAIGSLPFAMALKRQNIPRESIGNPARWKLITEDARVPFDVTKMVDVSTSFDRGSTHDRPNEPSTSTPYRTWIEFGETSRSTPNS